MAGYKELRDQWKYTEVEVGMNGTRAFIVDASGPDSLPIIGDAFDAVSAPYCLCRSIDTQYYGVTNGINQKKYTCNYSTQAFGGQTPVYNVDTEQRSFQAGCEAVSLPAPSRSKNVDFPWWNWRSDGTAAKDLDISMLIPSGTFTRSIKLVGDGAKDRWFTNKFLAHVGKTNKAAFENFRKGSVYFTGANGGAQYDKFGNRTWVMECQFAWKLIRGNTWNGANFIAITEDDWNYVARPTLTQAMVGQAKTAVAWDRPEQGQGSGLYLYQNDGDFTALMKP